MKKRRRSDRKKYQAVQPDSEWWQGFHLSERLVRRLNRRLVRDQSLYGEGGGELECVGMVLHVTGNSYRWEKA